MKLKDIKLLSVIIGAVLGAVVVLLIRFATYQTPKPVHYHANFEVFINGQREQFKGPMYYEEEAAMSCSASAATATETSPMSRVHMHDNINNVVHVEDSRVSWGNFFTVLGWNIGKDYIATIDTVYQNSGSTKITYILNGKKVDNVANTIIRDQDKLLINYGGQNQSQLNDEYGQIPNDALKADRSKDPAACGASRNSTTMSDRMKHMF